MISIEKQGFKCYGNSEEIWTLWSGEVLWRNWDLHSDPKNGKVVRYQEDKRHYS
jgi:hypothetical protein